MRVVKFGSLAVALALASCVSHTRISTEVNATITEVDSGRAIGTGSADYKDSKPVWRTTTFRIEKEGCDTKELTIHRSDDINIAAIIGGFFFFIPWLWAGDYHRTYGVALQCGRKAGAGH